MPPKSASRYEIPNGKVLTVKERENFFRQILLLMEQLRDNEHEIVSDKTMELRDKLQSRHRSIWLQRGRFPKSFNDEYVKNDKKEFKGMIPLASPRNNSSLYVLLEVNLKYRDSLAKVAVKCMFYNTSDMTKYGFRFESSEGEGSHDFFHVQPIGDFEGSKASSSEKDEGCKSLGIFDNFPSIPLHACSPVDILLSLVVSLYNLEKLRSMYLHFQNDETQLAGTIKEYLGKVACGLKNGFVTLHLKGSQNHYEWYGHSLEDHDRKALLAFLLGKSEKEVSKAKYDTNRPKSKSIIKI